jgi:hypothetical protein
MSNGSVFHIEGGQHAGGSIYNIARDLNISQNSTSEDMVKIIDAIKEQVNNLDIEEKDKKKIENRLQNAAIELEDKNPDKDSIANSIKQTNDILKEAKTTGESLKEIGILVAKAAVWLGTNAAKLGWVF